MSTAGSVRSGQSAQYTAPTGKKHEDKETRGGRRRLFRWQGIIPLLLASGLFVVGWTMFADRLLRDTIEEAGTKALGAQLDIDGLTIHTAATTMEMRGVALADPFDGTRNLFEIGRLLVVLEPKPLLEKKLIVKQVTIADVVTGTVRETPAQPVREGGFAPQAMAQVQKFVQQFRVPLLSLTPIDTLKALVLDPTQIRAVQAALALGRQADSAKGAIERNYAGLRIQETIDSSTALVARLQGTSVRTLGVQGTRTAIADLRRAIARVDSARGRVEGLVADTRRSLDSLQAGARAIDDARREDYAFARGLLHLPSFDAPDIGSALFGQVTIDKFQQAVYWATIARQYAPPGLLPKESEGPRRMRGAGTTVHFATPQSNPRFLIRRADVNITSGDGGAAYRVAAADVTTEPSIVGRPTLFALRRNATGGGVDSVRVTGSMDHLRARPKESVNAYAAGVKLPLLGVPSLPYTMDPGRGSSELRFVLDGDQISGRWSVRSNELTWKVDSARARSLNTIESLVARVLTGIGQLDLTAEIGGTLAAPRLAVRSNLDRQIANRLREVAGEEIAVAQEKVRAQVDKLVEEKSAPVKARIDELRAEAEGRVAEARDRLEAEKRKLEERLKTLGLATIIG